jgi:hypothetical protein
MDIVSIVADLWKLAIGVPVFGIGILVGGFGYRYLLKNDPTLLNNLVAKAEAELQAIAVKASAKAAVAVVPNTASTPVTPAAIVPAATSSIIVPGSTVAPVQTAPVAVTPSVV